MKFGLLLLSTLSLTSLVAHGAPAEGFAKVYQSQSGEIRLLVDGAVAKQIMALDGATDTAQDQTRVGPFACMNSAAGKPNCSVRLAKREGPQAGDGGDSVVLMPIQTLSEGAASIEPAGKFMILTLGDKVSQFLMESPHNKIVSETHTLMQSTVGDFACVREYSDASFVYDFFKLERGVYFECKLKLEAVPQ